MLPLKVAATKTTCKAVALASELGQIYPNPAATTTAITYHLPRRTEKATIVLHDVVTSRKVKNFGMPIGESEGNLNVELSELSNGLYTFSLVIDSKPVATNKLVVM